jgi:hypothetical protein
MKSLKNILNTSEKLLSKDDLKSLYGGSMGMGRGFDCTCYCWRGGGIPLGYLLNETDFCYDACRYAFNMYNDVSGSVEHCAIWN